MGSEMCIRDRDSALSRRHQEFESPTGHQRELESHLSGIVGTNSYEVPPVPIPNTEVKLIHAEDTKMATSWENRAAPTPFVSAAKLLLSC